MKANTSCAWLENLLQDFWTEIVLDICSCFLMDKIKWGDAEGGWG